MEPLRLKWSRTWPDKERDFACRTDEGHSVGRIYFVAESINNPDRWLWFCNGSYRGRSLSTSGHTPDKDSAAREVEVAWFKAVATIDAQM